MTKRTSCFVLILVAAIFATAFVNPAFAQITESRGFDTPPVAPTAPTAAGANTPAPPPAQQGFVTMEELEAYVEENATSFGVADHFHNEYVSAGQLNDAVNITLNEWIEDGLIGPSTPDWILFLVWIAAIAGSVTISALFFRRPTGHSGAIVLAMILFGAAVANAQAPSSITPNAGVPGATLEGVTIACTNGCGEVTALQFPPSARITISNIAVANNRVTANLAIAANGEPGRYVFRLTRSDGSMTDSGEVEFFVFSQDAGTLADYLTPRITAATNRAASMHPSAIHDLQARFQWAYGEEDGQIRYKDYVREPTHVAISLLMDAVTHRILSEDNVGYIQQGIQQNYDSIEALRTYVEDAINRLNASDMDAFEEIAELRNQFQERTHEFQELTARGENTTQATLDILSILDQMNTKIEKPGGWFFGLGGTPTPVSRDAAIQRAISLARTRLQ